tara:strand:+ start:351 stop:464 length:114 start_codon:yes stop_codon:yes gene_type:complete
MMVEALETVGVVERLLQVQMEVHRLVEQEEQEHQIQF